MIRIRAVRIAFFALLFANLVYFAWAHWIDVPRRAPPASESVGRLPQQGHAFPTAIGAKAFSPSEIARCVK